MGDKFLQYKKQLVYAAITFTVIAVVSFYIYQVFFHFNKFLPGVKIASVSVSDLSKDDATKKVDAWMQEHRNIPLTFFSDDYSYATNLEQLCVKPDVAVVVEDVWEKEKQRGIQSKIISMDGEETIAYPVKLAFEPAVTQTIVEEISAHLNRDFVNARLDMDSKAGLIIVPGIQGQKVDVDATFAGMPTYWEEFYDLQIPIVLKKTDPVVNEAQLSSMGELASFTTWYNVNEINRSHNLALAARSVNTSAISAGQEFSFNRIVGERTYRNGYRDAMIINNGLFEPGLGGGICQVSSTIYNAALLAGMEITERHNHALAVTYVPLARDATVAYGLQDFKFRNNTDSPIYIRAVAGGGGLTVNIYGHLDYKKNITINHVVDRVINFTEIVQVKEDLAPGTVIVEQKGNTGYVARAFRNFLDDTGKIIKTEPLSTDHYKAVNKIIFTGPSAEAPGEGNIPEEEIPDNMDLPQDIGPQPVGEESTFPGEPDEREDMQDESKPATDQQD